MSRERSHHIPVPRRPLNRRRFIVSADTGAPTYACDEASRFPSNIFWRHKAKCANSSRVAGQD